MKIKKKAFLEYTFCEFVLTFNGVGKTAFKIALYTTWSQTPIK